MGLDESRDIILYAAAAAAGVMLAQTARLEMRSTRNGHLIDLALFHVVITVFFYRQVLLNSDVARLWLEVLSPSGLQN